jgi:predicted nucleotidyltransferase
LASFFGAKAELEALLGRGVDLIEPSAVRNPYILASINRNREAVYEYGSEPNFDEHTLRR